MGKQGKHNANANILFMTNKNALSMTNKNALSMTNKNALLMTWFLLTHVMIFRFSREDRIPFSR